MTAIGGYLIYHPPRWVSKFEGDVVRVVYHDRIQNHNQDPYVWNQRFLHTYCHITQMSPQPGHINFWVSGNTFPKFDRLLCDLVFVVEGERYCWTDPNHIESTDKIVDSDYAYEDHYRWGGKEHFFRKRCRYTLKANPQKSFQPQSPPGELINIVPFLVQYGCTLERLQKGLYSDSGRGSKPMVLPSEVVNALYQSLTKAECQLRGNDLMLLRQRQNWKEAQRPPENRKHKEVLRA